jgi:hypothetical protein
MMRLRAHHKADWKLFINQDRATGPFLMAAGGDLKWIFTASDDIITIA